MAEHAVLDSSAILAVIFNEPGNRVVAPLLEGGLLSTVNLAEIHSRLLRMGIPPEFAWSAVFRFDCKICFFTEAQARIAAELITVTRPYGLSLGDRACLALAMERKARVYTTDRAWKTLNLEIAVEVIR